MKPASKMKKKRKVKEESAMHDHSGSAMEIDRVSAATLSNSETRKESDSSPLTETCEARAQLLLKEDRRVLNEQAQYKASGQRSLVAESSKHGHPVSTINEIAGATEDMSPIVKKHAKRKAKRNSVVQDFAGMDEPANRKFVVHVSRQEEVENGRKRLPILMMEQEIMEAIMENPVTIVCGETGCGKTTQVPQFLYEAAFSSSMCIERSGMIGITQPRRVAVLATAKRVSHEMNLRLGQEVGFQVRHDRNVGDNTRIKFMTDGILLREVQSDFLLRKYSVIVLDEAHERSLNTDILIGMLSRTLPLRQSLYEEQCRLVNSGQKSHGISVFPLKLVIMSATLCIDDFALNRGMFAQSPPVVHVPARQFPVTVHFSAKTELLDYVGRAYKKVCSIHKNLPPGGVLVFLTGQAEVHDLCKRLLKAFPKAKGRKGHDKGCNLELGSTPGEMKTSYEKESEDSTDLQLEDLFNTADDGFDNDLSWDEMETDEHGEVSHTTIDSSSESGHELMDATDIGHRETENAWNISKVLPLDAIKAAFEGFGSTEKDEGNKLLAILDQNVNRRVPTKVVGPLHVLPLYAMLPAAAQLKVFSAVPEGSRLVVVATNVAETSITIPGIRYVVDCGRAKEKIYERGSGITSYEVRWISKASAAQRAGRAGRTGPGHCYRLYSSAVFNDIFPEFSQPEINRTPIEGLVLLLKCMGITKVSNFPFPSQPDQTALAEAERCLQALSALDSNTGLLTPLGQTLSVYPISPRHSRMLVTAMQVGSTNDVLEESLLLAYAAAAAAALSLDSPFMTHIESQSRESMGCENDVEAVTSDSLAVAGLHLKGTTKRVKMLGTVGHTDTKFFGHARYKHPSSDVLSVVAALLEYEKSSDAEEFCRINHFHARVMYEMSKLRKQLVRLYLVFGKDGFKIGNTPYSGANMNDVEALWHGLGNHGLNAKLEQVLRQAICAGWADRVARKISLQEIIKSKDKGEYRKHKAVRYHACTTNDVVFLHPSSSLRKLAPEFVVYNELIHTSRPYMRIVTSVDARWLVLHATALCTFSKPLADPPPWYDASSDDVFCWVAPSFGPHLWELPLHKFPLKSSKHRIAVFACALLQGKVLPCIAILLPYLTADPTVLLTPAGQAHKRVSELLHVMAAAGVDSRRKLKSMWEAQPDFLYKEMLLWVQKTWYAELGRLWTCLKQEAQEDGLLENNKAKAKQRCK